MRTIVALALVLTNLFGCRTAGTDSPGALQSEDTRVFPPNMQTCSPDVDVCSNSLPCIQMYAPGAAGWERGESGDYCLSKENACKNECEKGPCYLQSQSFGRRHLVVWCAEDPMKDIDVTASSSTEATAAAYKSYCQYNPEFETKLATYLPAVTAVSQEDEEYKGNADYVNRLKKMAPLEFAVMSAYSGGLYRELNQWLWTGERPSAPNDYRCLYVSSLMLTKALEQFPSHKSVVYRGDSGDFHQAIGSTFVYRSFMSTSRKLSVALQFSSLQVWKIIPHKSGHWISPLALAGNNEDEVLFTPNTKLKVLKDEKDVMVEGTKVFHLITLEEVP